MGSFCHQQFFGNPTIIIFFSFYIWSFTWQLILTFFRLCLLFSPPITTMNAADVAAATPTTTLLSSPNKGSNKANGGRNGVNVIGRKKKGVNNANIGGVHCWKASFIKWTLDDVVYVARYHRIPCFFAAGLFFFMYVEYTLRMVPESSPPFDLGFVVTRSFHRALSSWPELNTVLAALNTVFDLLSDFSFSKKKV